jgi:hypothetical protein
VSHEPHVLAATGGPGAKDGGGGGGGRALSTDERQVRPSAPRLPCPRATTHTASAPPILSGRRVEGPREVPGPCCCCAVTQLRVCVCVCAGSQEMQIEQLQREKDGLAHELTLKAQLYQSELNLMREMLQGAVLLYASAHTHARLSLERRQTASDDRVQGTRRSARLLFNASPASRSRKSRCREMRSELTNWRCS